MTNRGFVNVDAFQRETTLQEAAEKCGVSLEVTGSGKNVRIDCPFGCDGDHAGKRDIAVDTDNAAKQWKCHSYGCEARGNLLNLMYGWLKGQRWSGDKLRGAEFNEVKQVISQDARPMTQKKAQPKQEEKVEGKPAEEKRNIPLCETEHAGSRGLMEPPIWEKFVREIRDMSPAASAYVRRHPCLSPEAMQKWDVGVLPMDGGGDKRGWSLRNHIIYTLRSEDNEVIGFAGRDPNHEDKLQEFEATPTENRDASKRPIKHRFPKGFHRGIELYGQQRERLDETGYREAIAKYGVIIVEGFNDVIRLDSAQIPAFGICSNRVTEEQLKKIVGMSKQLSNGRVTIFLDCDDEGEEGAKEAAWKLLQAGLDVRPAWGTVMYGGKFVNRQPESVTEEELRGAILPGITRE